MRLARINAIFGRIETPTNDLREADSSIASRLISHPRIPKSTLAPQSIQLLARLFPEAFRDADRCEMKARGDAPSRVALSRGRRGCERGCSSPEARFLDELAFL